MSDDQCLFIGLFVIVIIPMMVYVMLGQLHKNPKDSRDGSF